MSMKYIREAYRVPAYRGQRVRYLGNGTPREGRILSVKHAKLRVACDDGVRLLLHPTWEVQYLDEAGKVLSHHSDRPPSWPHDGQFANYRQWVNKARSWIGGTGAVTYDSQDRRCDIGRDFMRADAEGTFPVRFWYPEASL